jgi:hypothetical protein
MGAPGIEAGYPVTTMSGYVVLWPTGYARFQGFPVTMVYLEQPSPPTYETPVSHTYKCPGGQL